MAQLVMGCALQEVGSELSQRGIDIVVLSTNTSGENTCSAHASTSVLVSAQFINRKEYQCLYWHIEGGQTSFWPSAF